MWYCKGGGVRVPGEEGRGIVNRPGTSVGIVPGNLGLICCGHRRVNGSKYQSFHRRKEIHISKSVCVETDKNAKVLSTLKVGKFDVLASVEIMFSRIH